MPTGDFDPEALPACPHGIIQGVTGNCVQCFPARCCHGFTPMNECPLCYPNRSTWSAQISPVPEPIRAAGRTVASVARRTMSGLFSKKPKTKKRKKSPTKIPLRGRKFKFED